MQTWLPGTVASDRDVNGTVGLAEDLALFIQDVRSIEVGAQRLTGTNRGGDLRTHDAWMDECFERSAGLLDTAWLRHTWKQLRQLPRIALDVMTHGDLIPANLLVDNGRLTGVLDVGGLAPADSALDLVGAWHCLGSVARQRLRDVLLVDDLEWARGAAWAFEQAVGLVWYYTDTNPAMSELGRRTLDRIATDLPPLPTRRHRNITRHRGQQALQQLPTNAKKGTTNDYSW